jgi:hypothetical protein
MHGYCSGAPGIGIMMRRIRRILSASAGKDTAGGKIYDLCGRCADKAEAANAEIPLLYRDHLCCGNSSVAEYYLFSGDKERAGSVLNSMFIRKEKTGTYMTDPYGYRSQKSVLSLFYGIAGCGYEMLRYAFPDKVLSLFG